MPVAVTSLYHSSLNHLSGLTHSFLTDGLASYLTEIIVTISRKPHLLYYPHLPQFSFFPLSWRMPCLSSKDNTFVCILYFIFLSLPFFLLPIKCLLVPGFSKPGETVLNKTDVFPHWFSIPSCFLQALFNVHLFFYLQYIFSHWPVSAYKYV